MAKLLSLKKIYTYLLALCCLLPIAPQAMGQAFKDTLKDVSVTEQRKVYQQDVKSTFQTGQTRISIDSITLLQYQQLSLATLLAQQSTVFVKSYGINSMATLSFRGASSAQSAVLWKGIPILNPALGVSDVSMLQTGLFDKVSLQYGSNAAMLGSGNVGGALLLEQQSEYAKGNHYRIGMGAGSYGRKEINTQIILQPKKWLIKWNAFGQLANNNFPYTDLDGAVVHTSNAGLKAFGSILSATYKIDPTQHISADVWYQRYYREIPKAMFEDFSAKVQRDASLRTLLHWEKLHRQNTFYAKFSLNKEDLHYTDSSFLMDNRNTVYQYYQELGWKNNFHIGGTKATHTILVMSPFQYATIHLPGNERQQQQRPALAAAYKYLSGNERLGIQANLRQEWNLGTAFPILPGIGVHYALIRNARWQWSWDATLQKTYRLPTLNELYNFPGGNEQLKPEQGWNRELAYTLHWDNARGTIQFDQQVNYFNRHIKDWIYWLGGAIWTPHNIAEVHNRGIETHNTLRLQLSKPLQLQLGLRTAYVLSTTEKSDMPNDNSIGKQIPYTPRYNGQINIGLHWKQLFVNYNHTYTGYRFITTDESLYTLPYNLGNVQALYTFTAGSVKMQASLQVQNLWNTAYVVIAQRPMPQRYWVAGLQFEL